MKPKKITIKTVLNGWKVKVGCSEVVFTDQQQLFTALERYLDDPVPVEKAWCEDSVNAKHFKPAPGSFNGFYRDMLRGFSALDPVKGKVEEALTEDDGTPA